MTERERTAETPEEPLHCIPSECYLTHNHLVYQEKYCSSSLD